MDDDDLFLIWLAGFWDGEGSFYAMRTHAAKSTKRPEGWETFYPMATVTNTDFAVVQTITDFFERTQEPPTRSTRFGCLKTRSWKNPNWRQGYEFTARGSSAITVAHILLPHLKVKVPQATIMAGWPVKDTRRERRATSLGQRYAGSQRDDAAHEAQRAAWERLGELNHRGTS